MSEQHEIPAQTLDELDDVEGHGLKEVAAAAGIGAAVLGAGGAALAATSAAHITPRTPPLVQQTQRDGGGTTGDTTDHAGTFAASAAHNATSFASAETTGANALAANQIHASTTTVHTTADGAVSTVSALHSSAARTVGATEGSSMRTVSATQQSAGSTVSATERSAMSSATTVAQTSVKVTNAVSDRVNKGWDLQISVLGQNTATKGAPVDGTITITNHLGSVVASSTVHNGIALVHVTGAGSDKSFTVHFAPGPYTPYVGSSTTWVS
jgi:hypothetical protein